MSRVGNLPVKIPDGVSVEQKGVELFVSGPKGNLSSPLPHGIQMRQVEDNSIKQIVLERKSDEQSLVALHGTVRALLSNNVKGVSEGWERDLELVGVGYRVQLKGKQLVFALGYSHDIHFDIPESVTAKVTDQTKLNLACIDKQVLGQAAAQIRSFRPPEPYKAKGIRYADEVIVRKAGKAGKAGGK